MDFQSGQVPPSERPNKLFQIRRFVKRKLALQILFIVQTHNISTIDLSWQDLSPHGSVLFKAKKKETADGDRIGISEFTECRLMKWQAKSLPLRERPGAMGEIKG